MWNRYMTFKVYYEIIGNVNKQCEGFVMFVRWTRSKHFKNYILKISNG